MARINEHFDVYQAHIVLEDHSTKGARWYIRCKVVLNISLPSSIHSSQHPFNTISYSSHTMHFQLPKPLSLVLLLLQTASTSQTPSSPLNWDVYLAPAVHVNTTTGNYSFSQTAFTLIHGASTAILVDAPTTIASTNLLADWIERTIPGKKLTSVYITHGHGDHFFGIPVLQKRFPELKALATADVIAHAKLQIQPDSFDEFWGYLFPGQIAPQTQSWTELPSFGAFTLEGHTLKAVPVGQTDTFNTTVLHVPDLAMVVAGDTVYGEYFQYLVESNTSELRAQWIQALYEIEALEPKIVVPSHKQEFDGFGINHLAATREYLTVWGAELLEAKSKDDLKKRIVSAFPARKGDYILDISAAAASFVV